MIRRNRVLIVDDSPFMRMAIRRILTTDPGIDVVGVAADGLEGFEKAQELKPDVITMDVEMPRMDGITSVRKIMSMAPSRIIMVSSLTSEGANATFEALDAGAIDYILKPAVENSIGQSHFKEELLNKVTGMAAALIHSSQTVQGTSSDSAESSSQGISSKRRIGCIGIGASTGGPVAVQEVISLLPESFACPVIVAVHMPKAFTGPFAERLNAKCKIAVREARDGDLLRNGTVLIAPGGQHTTLVRSAAGIVVKLSPATAHTGVYIPSVDLLMSSLADSASNGALGVILTGMGADGCKGMQHVKTRGGMTLVQDQATSTVYGMPKACIEVGIADIVLPLCKIGPMIEQLVAG
jgi:two-component system, chemotaxis family, protein-glutamate methylesterase/glutaminase